MRYTVITMSKESYKYITTIQAAFNFNPEYNKLTRVSGRADSWMLDLIKQKDGVYLAKNQRSDEAILTHPLQYMTFLLIPESHPLFNAVCIEYIDLELVYRERINLFLKNVSESMVRELLNN